MKFLQPRTVDEALSMAQVPGACFLAGGTDLVLSIRKGKTRPDALIDLGRLTELKGITVENDSLRIGSMVTFRELSDSSEVQKYARALWLACQTMGSPQIRNQATIGGNLGNCSPAADGLPPLLALGASVHLKDVEGEKSVAVDELLAQWPLAQGALVTGFSIPLAQRASGFFKLGRRQALAIARMSIAIAVKVEGRTAVEVRAAFGAVGKHAFLSKELGNRLTGTEITEAWLAEAVQGAQAVVEAALGNRASAPYKRIAARGVMRQALESLDVDLGLDLFGNREGVEPERGITNAD